MVTRLQALFWVDLEARMERESKVEKWLGDKLRPMGFLYWKFTSPGSPGVPDRVLICPDGAVIWVELKTETGRLSRQQQVRIHELMGRGQQVAVVHGMLEARYFAQQMIRVHVEGGGKRGEV